MTIDETTLSLSTATGLSVPSDSAPALTIVWHPDVTRVGEMLSLHDLRASADLPLSRLSPVFTTHVAGQPKPLADAYVSKTPWFSLSRTRDAVRLTPLVSGAAVEVDGSPLTRPLQLSYAALAAGVVIMVARRIVLCLHLAAPLRAAQPDLGLLGHSDVMQRARASILAVADLDIPVLIRGETGTGKELTASAIVKRSQRADRPLVALNMAAIPPSTAAAELFGYEKGAFTGATDSRKGHFVDADGGTLFLDEIGLAPLDVQSAILRVIETGEFKPLGARAARKVNVRLLAATDAHLEEQMAKATFSEALYHRLSAFQVRLPPLRERRQDIGVLFLHFLQQILAETNETHRLAPDPSRKMWLPASAMARIARAPWPGNVRQLRNAAIQIAVASRGADRAVIDANLLPEFAPTQPNVPVSAPDQPSPAPDVVAADISDAEVVEAMRANQWKPALAASALRISRTTIYQLINKNPLLRKASEVPDAEISRLMQKTDGDLKKVADQLQLSTRALQLRLNSIKRR
jgi:two-component system nitrogen regulation response regulator GlnG